MAFDLEPIDHGIAVTPTAEAHPSGTRRVLAQVMQSVMAKQISGPRVGGR